MEQPEIRGLRISAEGLLLQDIAPESTTDLSGEFLWDYALRRRACAADIAGLLPFEVMDAWHETLKAYFLMAPPPGYRKVSWTQLKNADELLWKKIAAKCETGTKAPPGETRTQFEIAWRELCLDQDVRMHLQFLQGVGSSAASSNDDVNGELKRLRNRLANAENQLRSQKRKWTDEKTNSGEKGKGAGRGKRRGGAARAPQELKGYPTKTPEGKNICFNFNLRGCPHAKPGQACFKGVHVCPKCFGPHCLSACTPS